MHGPEPTHRRTLAREQEQPGGVRGRGGGCPERRKRRRRLRGKGEGGRAEVGADGEVVG